MPRTARSSINSANASRQGRNSIWTPDRVALLYAYAAEGLWASEIARRMGGEITKNMVIGKAKREELPLRSRQEYLTALRAEAAQRKSAAIRRRIEWLQTQLTKARHQLPSPVARETSEKASA